MSTDDRLRALERQAALGTSGAAERLALAQARYEDAPPMRWPTVKRDRSTVTHLWVGPGNFDYDMVFSGYGQDGWLRTIAARTACRARSPRAGRLWQNEALPKASDQTPTCQRCRATTVFEYVRLRGLPDWGMWSGVPEPLRRWVARHLRADAERQEGMSNAR